MELTHQLYRDKCQLRSYCRQIENGTDTSTTSTSVNYVAIIGKLKMVLTRQLQRQVSIT